MVAPMAARLYAETTPVLEPAQVGGRGVGGRAQGKHPDCSPEFRLLSGPMNPRMNLIAAAAVFVQQAAVGSQPEKGEMAGYLLVPTERVARTYNAGFSMY